MGKLSSVRKPPLPLPRVAPAPSTNAEGSDVPHNHTHTQNVSARLIAANHEITALILYAAPR
jgi:hypothetical protein